MSKRKAEPSAGRSGKQKAAPELSHMDSQDLLSGLLGGGDESEREDSLLPTAEDLEDGDDDALAEALCAEDDNLLPDESGDAPPLIDDEIGELPDGLEEAHLEEPEEVDLSKHELTVPQARRVAQVLARNSSLSKIKMAAHALAVSDLEDDELEWDSEEYTDVEAIIIAELLKGNSTVQRLDLARNNIGDAGACALAQMLCTNSSIEYLNLESNEFGERAGHAFVQAVGQNSALTYLNLKENAVTGAVQEALRDKWQASRPDGHGVGLHF